MTFDQALTFVLSWEGGYSNHPDDPGGETNMGITKYTARAHGYKGSMRNLPLELVKRIYRQGYWQPCRLDDFPHHPLRLAVFDAAINSGSGQSRKWLQMELGTTPDGIIGPVTIGAIQALASDPHGLDDLITRLIDRRLAFLQSLRGWKTFGKGWSRRLNALRSICLGPRPAGSGFGP
jgi:lysozyme family protein